MANLSPAAQAVLDAAYALPLKNGQPSIAAVLRAAADVALPRNAGGMANRQELRAYILAIAAELEGHA